MLDKNWFPQLVENCQAAWVEGNFSATQALLESRHEIGRLIREESEKYKKPIKELCNSVAISMGKSERSIYYAVELHKKFPLLEEAPWGKNITYREVCHTYLPEVKREKLPIKCKKCEEHCPKT